MPEVSHCHIPITLRIVGVLTEDQLAAVGTTLTRSVTARLAEAQRRLADRHRLVLADPPDHRLVGPGSEPDAPLTGVEQSGPDVIALDDLAPDNLVLDGLARDDLAPEIAALIRARSADITQAATRPITVSPAESGQAAGSAPLGLEPGPRVPAAPASTGVRAATARPERGRVAFIKTGGPVEPVARRTDEVIDRALRENRGSPPPRRPAEPVLPGDSRQQREAVIDVDPIDLWRLPHVQDTFRQLAEAREAWNRTHRAGQRTLDAAYWMNYWRIRFTNSVNYILKVRQTRSYHGSRTAREFSLARLRDAEKELVKTSPPDLLARVEELRRTAHEKWAEEVALATDQFLRLAQNEVDFLTEDGPIRVYGLPEWVEGTIPASSFPKLFEQGSASPGFSPSVARLMAAVQRTWGKKVLAENYRDHEKSNAFVGNIDGIGKYSFDVHLPVAQVDGFYEHDAAIAFFKAVEQAAKATEIEWMALYNDASVANAVNSAVGVR
ncbi:MAG: hypothetical protein ABIS86_20300, partial [Streptosporangiaceae bacterium]